VVVVITAPELGCRFGGPFEASVKWVLLLVLVERDGSNELETVLGIVGFAYELWLEVFG
jgi:hypothetical protein